MHPDEILEFLVKGQNGRLEHDAVVDEVVVQVFPNRSKSPGSKYFPRPGDFPARRLPLRQSVGVGLGLGGQLAQFQKFAAPGQALVGKQGLFGLREAGAASEGLEAGAGDEHFLNVSQRQLGSAHLHPVYHLPWLH